MALLRGALESVEPLPIFIRELREFATEGAQYGFCDAGLLLAALFRDRQNPSQGFHCRYSFQRNVRMRLRRYPGTKPLRTGQIFYRVVEGYVYRIRYNQQLDPTPPR